jgi:hypothetical protein
VEPNRVVHMVRSVVLLGEYNMRLKAYEVVWFGAVLWSCWCFVALCCCGFVALCCCVVSWRYVVASFHAAVLFMPALALTSSLCARRTLLPATDDGVRQPYTRLQNQLDHAILIPTPPPRESAAHMQAQDRPSHPRPTRSQIAGDASCGDLDGNYLRLDDPRPRSVRMFVACSCARWSGVALAPHFCVCVRTWIR